MTKPSVNTAKPPVNPLSESEQVLSELEFSPDNVVEAACRNPVLFMRAVNARMGCLFELNRAKMALNLIESETELEVRAAARDRGERATVDVVSAQLSVLPKIINAREELLRAEEREEKAKLVVDAFRQRRDMLTVVGQLVRDEVSLSRAAEMGQERLSEARRDLRKRFPGT